MQALLLTGWMAQRRCMLQATLGAAAAAATWLPGRAGAADAADPFEGDPFKLFQ